jgi:hypothetical protein
MSTLAFSLAHSPEGRIGAAVSGAYLGYLAHRYGGRLGPGTAVHFWSVLLLDIETVLLTWHAQRRVPTISAEISLPIPI